VVGALLWCEAIEQGSDALPGCFDSSLGVSEQRFQLGDHPPDRIEVRTVGLQEERPGADRANGPTHRMALVAAEIVHDDNVAGLERRHEELLDIGFDLRAPLLSRKMACGRDDVAGTARLAELPRTF
jgi:hypothetical protein